jgi:hypothetical protein
MVARGLKAVFFLAAVMLARAPALGARTDADSWVLLHSATVATKDGAQVLTLPDSAPRTLAIRLSAKGGPVSLTRVVVTYGNGQIHFENWPKNQPVRLLPESTRSRLISGKKRGSSTRLHCRLSPPLLPTKV